MSRGHTDVPALVTFACPVAEVIDHVSGRWTVGILTVAAAGPVRFSELQRAVRGISKRILTMKLRQLERDGLLIRTVYATVPPRVEYSLTDIAEELMESLRGLTGWAARHRHAVAAAREAYDRSAGAGSQA